MAVIVSILTLLIFAFLVWASSRHSGMGDTETDQFVAAMEKATQALNDVHDVAQELSDSNLFLRSEFAAVQTIVTNEFLLMNERMQKLHDALTSALEELRAAHAVHLHIAASHGRATDVKP